jgi:hypothetical protein
MRKRTVALLSVATVALWAFIKWAADQIAGNVVADFIVGLLPKSGWATMTAAFVANAVFIGIACAIVIGTYWLGVSDKRHLAGRNKEEKLRAQVPSEVITNQYFNKERVSLDGKTFIGCRFHQVTFVFNGTSTFSLQHCHIYPPFRIFTESTEVSALMEFLHEFNLLKIDFVDSQGNTRPRTTTFIGKTTSPPSGAGEDSN